MIFRKLFTILFLLLSGNLSASEVKLSLETGRVKIKKQGIVRFINHSDSSSPLTLDLELEEQILTGKNTRATISLRGKEEEIRLRAFTLFKVNSLKSNQTEVEMPTGKARFIIKRKLNRMKKRRRQFNVRTVTAVVGVRGTEFVMGVSGASTSLLTLDGSVEMAAAAAPQIKVVVVMGQASKMEVGKAPTPPMNVPPALQNSIVESDSPDTFNEVSFPPAQNLKEAVMEQKEKEESQEEEKPEEENSGQEDNNEENDPSMKPQQPESEKTTSMDSELDQAEIETIEGPDLEELDMINDIMNDITETVDEINESKQNIQLDIDFNRN